MQEEEADHPLLFCHHHLKKKPTSENAAFWKSTLCYDTNRANCSRGRFGPPHPPPPQSCGRTDKALFVGRNGKMDSRI